MMLAFIILSWDVIGVAGIIFLSWDREAFTWGNLFWCVVLGCFVGPLLGVIIGLKILVEADFWNKPIFGKRKGS
jgi:hypothetical protein